MSGNGDGEGRAERYGEGGGEGGEEKEKGGEFGGEDLARANGEPGEREAIVECGEERVPLNKGKQGGEGHREDEESDQVFADSGVVKGTGGDVRVLEMVIAVREEVEADDGDGDEDGEDADGDLLPVAGGGDHLGIEEADEEVADELEGVAVRFGEEFAKAFHTASLCCNDVEDAVGDCVGILRVGELGEDAFKGGLRHVVAEVGDGIVGDDLSLAKDEHRVGYFLDDLQDVGGVEDHFAAGGEGVEEGTEDHRGVDVESGEGLVEDQEFRVVQKGGEEENFLAHSLGVGGEGVVAVGPESDEVEEVVHFGFEGVAGNAAEAAGELEVLAAGEVGIGGAALRGRSRGGAGRI